MVCELTDFLNIDSHTGRIRYREKPALTLPPHLDFYLVRHAETFANQKKVLQGSDQESGLTQLSPLGSRQAEELAHFLIDGLISDKRPISSVTVFSSPAVRARATAQFFWDQLGLRSKTPAVREEHGFLNEIRFGKMSGLTEEQIHEFGPEYVEFTEQFRRQGNALTQAGGSESFCQLLERVCRGLQERFDFWREKWAMQERPVVLIFTHMLAASAVRVLLRDEKLVVSDTRGGTPFVQWRTLIQNAECLGWESAQRRFVSRAICKGESIAEF